MDGWAIRIPNDFKLFLSSYRNKEQPCQMLKEFWSSPKAAPPIIEMFNSSFGWKPTPTSVTQKGIQAFALYVNHAKMTRFKNFVIRSSDTDVFFTLLCHTCYMDITIYQIRQQERKGRSQVDLSHLPFCRDLFTHIQRSNHRLACYNRTASTIFERPKLLTINDGKCQTKDI